MANDSDEQAPALPKSPTNATPSPDTSIVDAEPAGAEPSALVASSRTVDRGKPISFGAGQPVDSAEALLRATKTVMSSTESRGPAAALSAFARLPESIQRQHLEIESQSQKQQYELELRRIEVEARDRSEARSLSATQHENEKRREQRSSDQIFGYVALITAALMGLVIYLYVIGQKDAATTVLSHSGSVGAGLLGGHGLSKARAAKAKASDKESES